MEAWLPLFDIFLNSPTPESDASQWMQHSSNTTTSTSSFISLLTKPIHVTITTSPSSSSPSQPHLTQTIMWIQSLPNAIQTRILSFLRINNKRFSKTDLSSLANTILKGNKDLEDFWVKKAAHHLLDEISGTNFHWVATLNLDCSPTDTFEALPNWLQDMNTSAQCRMFPWLPITYDELKCSYFDDSFDENSLVEMDIESRYVDNVQMVETVNATIDDETRRKAISLKEKILELGFGTKGVDLGNEICELCIGNENSPVELFSLLEPWEADDETASIILTHLSNVRKEDSLWQCRLLGSIVLPKMLVLSEPGSRVLVTGAIEFCKRYQKAAVDALLFPLILRKEGINNHICDVVTKIMRESLHPTHVSAFCQRLLCGKQGERKLVYLPCHQCLLSDELVWTESLFVLFQNILNHNVYLTQDSVDRLAVMVEQLSDRYSRSLKFANFLLSLVTKCEPALKSHKLLLTKAVEQTNTFMTKSILLKLYSW